MSTRKKFLLSLALLAGGAFSYLSTLHGQFGATGLWLTPRGNAQHTGWQRTETKFTKDSLGEFKFLWKLKLGKDAQLRTPVEPLLLPQLITARGFKDMAIVVEANDVYAVDSELGTLLWEKQIRTQPSGTGIAATACRTNFGANAVVEPPSTGRGRGAAGAPSPAPTQRHMGGGAGDGQFIRLRGLYVLTNDGYIHEQVVATGADYAPPMPFSSAGNVRPSALNIAANVLYATSDGCSGVPSGVWSFDMNTLNFTTNSYMTNKVPLLGADGPAIGSDGTVYVQTGSGQADPSANVYPNSVVALTPKELKVKDWYSASSAGSPQLANFAPIQFLFRDKPVIAAPGENGSVVLLDAASLGGSDHHSALAKSDSFLSGAVQDAASLASWEDKNDSSWVLAPVHGALQKGVKFSLTNGATPHGAVVAFHVEDKDGKPSLTPAWISRDLVNPSSPVIAGGFVFVLSRGETAKQGHATLYVLDATSGKDVWWSGDQISSSAALARVSISSGHVFFVADDNVIYSFGIPLEH